MDELKLAAGIVAGKPAYESALASQRLKGESAFSAGGTSLRKLMSGRNVMLVGEGKANCNINAHFVLEFSIENTEIMENCP